MKVIWWLLEHQASTDRESLDGQTAKFPATQEDNSRMIALFERHGLIDRLIWLLIQPEVGLKPQFQANSLLGDISCSGRIIPMILFPCRLGGKDEILTKLCISSWLVTTS
jgi:hypothetical protein